MGKFDTHIGESKEYDIDGEKYLFKPLTIRHLSKFFEVMKAFGDTKNEEDIFKNLTPGVADTLAELISAMLQKSYPDIEEEKRNEFALKYFSILMQALFEINNFGAQQDNEAMEKVNALRDRISKKDADTPKV